MNNQELADKVVALGIGQASNMPFQTEVHYRLTGQIGSHFEWQSAEQFVCDWRVTGALMERVAEMYASNFDAVIEGNESAVWVHGHTHRNVDVEVHVTRILCNPRGYFPDDLNREFNEKFTFKV